MDKFEELKEFISKYQEKHFSEVLKENNVDMEKVKHFDFSVINKASINVKDRTIEVIATSEVKDRQGDIVMVNGISLDNFMRNPVVPFAHNYAELPVAKAISWRFEEKKLLMILQFPTKEMYEFADTVFQMYVNGYLNAVSIGFIPKETSYDETEKAFKILTSELLEVSVVPVPANQEALVRALKKDFQDNVQPEGEKEDEGDDEKESDAETIEKEVNEHNKTVVKLYRKFQVQFRDILGIEATDDEEETIEKVFSHVLSVLKLIQQHFPQKTSEEEIIENPIENQEGEESLENLAKTILKNF